MSMIVLMVAGCGRLGFEARTESDAAENDADPTCSVTTLDRLDCAPTAGCAVPPACSQLALLLHFDGSQAHGETAARAHDFSGSGNHVTCAGATCPAAIAGRFGGGFRFDGLDRFEAPDAPSLNAVVGVTMSVWFQPTMSSPSYAPIVTRWRPGIGDSNYRLAQNVDRFCVNYGVGYNWQNHETPSGYPNGAWHHLVGTIDDPANRIRIWVNGTLAGEFTNTIDSEPNAGSLWIGWAEEEDGVVGVIDEVAVWTRVLSDQEIAALY